MTPLDLDRKRDLGRILDDSFGIYRRHWRTLLLVAFAVAGPVYLVIYGVGLGWLWSGYEGGPEAGEALTVGDLTEGFGGTLAQLLVVTPLVTAMTIHIVRAAARGERLPAGDAVSAGLKDFGPLFLAILLVAAGVALGLLALIVPGLILAVRWVLVSQIVVIEGGRGTGALRRSFELTRGFAWHTFLVVLVVNLLVGVFTALLMVPLELGAEAADTMALSLLGQILGTVISLPVVAVAYTLLYHSLLVQKGERRPAEATEPAPEPAAGAPRSLEGVPGTFGDGFAPPRPPSPGGTPGG